MAKAYKTLLKEYQEARGEYEACISQEQMLHELLNYAQIRLKQAHEKCERASISWLAEKNARENRGKK